MFGLKHLVLIAAGFLQPNTFPSFAKCPKRSIGMMEFTAKNPTREIMVTNIPPERDFLSHNRMLQRRKIILIAMPIVSGFSFSCNGRALEVERKPVNPTTIEEPLECQNGRIISESAVPGAYLQSCMDLKYRTFHLKSTGGTIVIEQDTGKSRGITGRTGAAVWNSGILLTRLLDEIIQFHSSIFNERTVVELGCGTGLASIAAAKLGAALVYATDANPEVLDLAKRNIKRNNVSAVTTELLKWGLFDAAEFENKADIIIGSDLTYNSGSWLVLAETMTTILKPGGFVMYLSLGHSGFNVAGEVGGFLSIAENVGLHVNSGQAVNVITCSQLDDLLPKILTPNEKYMIDENGGMRVIVLTKNK